MLQYQLTNSPWTPWKKYCSYCERDVRSRGLYHDAIELNEHDVFVRTKQFICYMCMIQHFKDWLLRRDAIKVRQLLNKTENHVHGTAKMSILSRIRQDSPESARTNPNGAGSSPQPG